MLARRALAKSGHEIMLAASPEIAREHIRAHRPDLLVVDYQLEDESGLSFLRRLHQEGLTIPALMVSGYSDEERAIEALRSGVSDIIPKTVDYLERLPAAIEQTLEKIRDRQRKATEKRRVEQETIQRDLANTLPHLVWSADSTGDLRFVNERWPEFSGLDAETLLGDGWMQLVHPEDRARLRAAWIAATEFADAPHSQPRAQAPFHVEYRLRDRHGNYRWFLAQAARMQNQKSGEMLWFGTCVEEEARKQAEAQREAILQSERAARADAERAARIKDEFVATLSHELRTPLNAIIGWSQYLQRAADDPARLGKGLEIILRNARIQAQMVDDLLDMSRIMAGKLRLDLAPVGLRAVVEDTLASVQHAAAAKNITLQLMADTDPIVPGDPNRLQQVVWNLLTNAIKFTPRDGHVEIMLRCEAHEVELVVRDNGRGISAAFLPHVFDRFRQEDASISRDVTGLGLGLSLSRQLVEMHDGRITAASQGEGKGAVFSVVLPLVSGTVRAPTRPPASIPMSEPDPALGMLAGLTILTLEDEADGRELVQRVLEEHGAQVTATANATEAWAAYDATSPDIILSDIGLPGVDGYDFIRRIREHEGTRAGQRPTPAAALTALARHEDRRRALLAGFQTHVSKPVDPSELLTVIASLAGRSAAVYSQTPRNGHAERHSGATPPPIFSGSPFGDQTGITR